MGSLTEVNDLRFKVAVDAYLNVFVFDLERLLQHMYILSPFQTPFKISDKLQLLLLPIQGFGSTGPFRDSCQVNLSCFSFLVS
jgi:hypothetical protein